MGFLDRLFGGGVDRQYEETVNTVKRQSAERVAGMSEDERAIARYRYLLQTAPPEAIEQVHAEAFAALTPEQRQQVFEALKNNAPSGDAPEPPILNRSRSARLAPRCVRPEPSSGHSRLAPEQPASMAVSVAGLAACLLVPCWATLPDSLSPLPS